MTAVRNTHGEECAEVWSSDTFHYLALKIPTETTTRMAAVRNTHLEQGEEVCITDSSHSLFLILLKWQRCEILTLSRARKSESLMPLSFSSKPARWDNIACMGFLQTMSKIGANLLLSMC
jgi:hypothetical protein